MNRLGGVVRDNVERGVLSAWTTRGFYRDGDFSGLTGRDDHHVGAGRDHRNAGLEGSDGQR